MSGGQLDRPAVAGVVGMEADLEYGIQIRRGESGGGAREERRIVGIRGRGAVMVDNH